MHERETSTSSKQVQYATFEWLQWDWIHNQWGCRVMVAMTNAFSNVRLRKSWSVGLKNNISLPLHQINKTAAAESPPYSIVHHLKENEGDRLTTMTPKWIKHIMPTIHNKWKFHLDCGVCAKIATDRFLWCCICQNIIQFQCMLPEYHIYIVSNSNQTFTSIKYNSSHNILILINTSETNRDY